MRLPHWRFTVRRMMVAVAVLVVVSLLLIFARCEKGVASECNYDKITTGMTVSEAEAILGLSQEMEREYVPGTRDGPVVEGERYFRWEDKAYGRVVWVGLKGGRVGSKWYWEPSF